MVNYFLDNGLLLSSVLGLLLVVAITVWIIKRHSIGLDPRFHGDDKKTWDDKATIVNKTVVVNAINSETTEEISLKLNLARQYLDIEDPESAQELLEEVAEIGDEHNKTVALAMLSQLKSALPPRS